jgi:hypothetical protein
MLELNEQEVDGVAGGPIIVLRVVQAVRTAERVAEEIIELGERLHDAVCQH